MPYFPTTDEIQRLGFLVGLDESGDELIYMSKGVGKTLTLENDEGYAIVMEWLPDGPHAWSTCECYEAIEAACEYAFDTIAEGRVDPSLPF